jgi:hypothetical protein
MKNNSGSSRRNFIKNLAASTAAVAVGSKVFANEFKDNYFEFLKRGGASANDKINIALIGSGGMGVQDTLTALQVPGIKLVAACDLYDGRLKEAKSLITMILQSYSSLFG